MHGEGGFFVPSSKADKAGAIFESHAVLNSDRGWAGGSSSALIYLFQLCAEQKNKSSYLLMLVNLDCYAGVKS